MDRTAIHCSIHIAGVSHFVSLWTYSEYSDGFIPKLLYEIINKRTAFGSGCRKACLI